MTILVTGGAGYIGVHTCIELLARGERVVVLDNLVNGHTEAVRRAERLAGGSIPLIVGDVRDRQVLDQVFARHTVDAVVHFAGLKAVGESASEPLSYYANNVTGTVTLMEAMRAHGVRTLVFSSSATVYGTPAGLPIAEDHPLNPQSPYGRTKHMVEAILGDVARSDAGWRIATLRYFNPAGAHESGLVGEQPVGTPNNLMPYVAQVAVGRRPYVNVFGADYPTEDGTGVRDYVHVVDLARGHLAALDRLRERRGSFTVNLGTGSGISVLELIRAFEAECGKPIAYRVVERRPGDVAACYADASLAHRLLGWQATRDYRAMCRDAWRWQSRNADGYGMPASRGEDRPDRVRASGG